ncbi:DUF4179 domain-containing protein [Paenibacillus hemerocallicola]|uniref:DUF4179 domain-containing protein n=1 Tax=Paenibacillus hemerocallicola TaxID=1172614 RepID=A0A5C4T6X3_9BACL|nr:DUF4179 domain-containing protein [Paenibacillus hemerocallicola]TNJ64420.1 DUF4179 domain-containing protein [Paenibacillus hemerocallicola]
MKHNRKWSSVCLAAVIVLTGIGNISSGFANELLEPILNRSIPENSMQIQVTPPQPSDELLLQTRSESVPSKPIKALESGTMQQGIDPNTPVDQYNISREQADELFDQGFSIDDILKADELANIWDVDPFQLLEEKKQSEWTSIENRLQLAKYGPLVDELKRKHSDAGKLLDKETLTLGEQFSLLALVDQSLVPDMKDALDRYQAKGRVGIAEIHRENRFYGKVSKTNMEKYGLTDKEVIGLRLTDEKLSRMEQASGSAVADLLKKRKDSLSHQIQEQFDVAGGSEKP